MFAKIFCVLAVAIPLSSAQYIPRKNDCPSQFLYVFEKGQIYGEIRIPYEPVPAAVIQVSLVFAQRVPDSKVGIEMTQPGNKIPDEGLVYKLTFPNQEVIPQITEIKMNDRVLCQGEPEQALVDGPFENGLLPVTVNHRTRFFGPEKQRKVEVWYDEVQEKETELPFIFY